MRTSLRVMSQDDQQHDLGRQSVTCSVYLHGQCYDLGCGLDSAELATADAHE